MLGVSVRSDDLIVEAAVIGLTGLLLVGGFWLHRLIRRKWDRSDLGQRMKERKYRKYR